MSYKSIEEYITYLVDNQVNVNIIDFVKEVNKLEFKIDITFIDEFIELVSKNECCIHHNMLEKYEVLKLDKGTTRVKELLEQNNFIEKKDFNLSNIREVRKNRGTVIKNEYYLHPRAFKLCLMRSKNKKEYAYYYLLLEECIKYYNDYKDKMKQTEINRLMNKMDVLHIDNKETHNKLDKAHEDNEKLHEDNKIIIEQLKASNENLVTLQDEFDIVHEKLDDRVPNAKQKKISERFVVLKHDTENMYYIITRKERTIKISIDRMADSGYHQIIIQYECCPNARLLLNEMKDNMKEYYKFSNKGNCREFKLLKTENSFINKLTELYNSRRM